MIESVVLSCLDGCACQKSNPDVLVIEPTQRQGREPLSDSHIFEVVYQAEHYNKALISIENTVIPAKAGTQTGRSGA